jgi:hypothetical protein
MNTATQLLAQSLDWMRLSNPDLKIVENIKAYLAKQQVEQETMSEDDIRALWKYSPEFFDGLTFARAIEAYHGIK